MRIREQKAFRKAMRQKVLESAVFYQAILKAKKKRDSVKLKNEGPLDWGKVDKRNRPPIAEHPFHKLDNMKLRYIQKDAGEAAKAMRGHDKRAEAKYLDQVNDATTILHYRSRGGKQFKEAVTKLGRPAAVNQQVDAARIIYKSLTGRKPSVATVRVLSPHNVINDAVIDFLKGRHTPDGWRIAGKILNKATELGIKWDQKLLKPMTRYAMKMDESASSGEILKPGTQVKIPSLGRRFYKDLRGKIIRYDKGYPYGKPFYVVDVGKIASEKVPVHQVVKEVAGISAPKPPSEVDRLKVRQTTDLITLKQRQATELMAAKIRDVETKAREAQTKATAPKQSAAISAS